MDPERWTKIEALFAGALQRPTADRTTYLKEACAGDESLLAEITNLLDADQQADCFIEEVVGVGARIFEQLDTVPSGQSVGRSIGTYRLIREIGRGGMSLVYLAGRADDAFQKEVAIKLIRRGMDTRELRRRFRIERQILASLEHPNIARLYDGGTTEDGLPYFVMEYIKGEPIDVYCDRHELSLSQRITLFRKVCSAVHCAHRNLIVHRDLKPSNVLVTETGIPKLLDFGIAKLLHPSPNDKTNTGQDLRPMTPGFASPEQLLGGPITTATDVYSLGVLLYLLLSGHRPYRLEMGTPAQIEKLVCEKEPERPSSMVSHDREADRGGHRTASELSRLRRTNPDQLRRQLQGDLDNILLLALSKEPERRYISVAQFANDLACFQEGRPVLARKNTFGYLARKFVKRHWLGTGTVTAFLLLLLSFTAAMFLSATRTKRERDRAEEVSSLLVNMFEIAEPGELRGSSITGRELLDRGAENVAQLSDHPQTQAMLLDTLAQMYHRLGLYDRAENMYSRGLALRRGLWEGDNPELAANLRNLGRELAYYGDFDSAEKSFRASLEMRVRLFGEEHEDVSQSLNNLALVLHDQGRYKEAEELYNRVVALDIRLFGKNHSKSTLSRTNFALFLYDRGKYAQAVQVLEEVQAIHRKQLPEEEAQIKHSLAWLAMSHQALGHFDVAEREFRQILTALRNIYGEEQRDLAHSLNNLGGIRRVRGDLGGAEPLLQQALSIRLARLGEQHAELASSYEELAALYLDCAFLDLAEEFYLRALNNYRENFSENHPLVGRPLIGLGCVNQRLGRLAEAEHYLLRGMALLSPADYRMAQAQSVLAECLVTRGLFQDARYLLEQSLVAYTRRLGADHPKTEAVKQRLNNLP